MVAMDQRKHGKHNTFPVPRCLLVLVTLLYSLGAFGQDDAGVAQDKPAPFVPPGFEALLEPQTTLVDIYLAGEFLTSQLATFTADEITFSAPAAIVQRIPLLLDSVSVENALTGPLPTHLEHICQYDGQQDCGQLKPNVAGVIFDEGQFRAELFINSELLAVRSAGHRRFLPPSDADWSWLQSLSGAYAGSREIDQDSYSLSSNSMLAFRENRFQVIGNYASEEGSTVDTAVIRRDWEGMEYQLGYFRSNSGSFQFMSNSPVRGLRIASSLDTREDLRQTAGNELVVFLESRSEVSLYKDGRLLSSRFYDAGNQVLDSSQLPGGAYDVTIRIRDSSGRVEEETRFYVKSTQLPPADQALYFLEAGQLLDPEDRSGLPESHDLTLLRAGYYGRLNGQLGVLTGLSQVDSHSSLELGLTHLGRHHDVSLGGFAANGDRKGARANLRGRLGFMFASANYRRVWNEEYDPNDPADLFGQSSSQASLNLTTLLPVGRLELGGRYNRRGDDALETYTARYEFPRLRMGPSEMLSGLQFSREDGRNTGLFTVELRFNGEHFTSQVQPEYHRDEAADGSRDDSWRNKAVLSWRDRELLEDSDLRLDLRGQQDRDISSIGTEMDYASQMGRLRLQAERIEQDQLSTNRYNGNAYTSFMVNSNSAKVGGRDQSQSALLIEIHGRLKDAVFDVLVNGNPRATAHPGRTTVVNLRPYETYDIRLRQRGSSFVEYDQSAKQVTLYPGNVVTLNWSVAELNVVFGRIVGPDWQPVANALVGGVAGLATTDDSGLFQAELRSDVKAIEVETRDSRCTIPLPDYELKNSIGNLGTLPCSLEPK